MSRLAAILRHAVTLAFLATPAFATDASNLAEDKFSAVTSAAPGGPFSFGSYAKGCLAGGVRLAEDGPNWAAMRLSRGRNWGHPAITAFIVRLADGAQRMGYEGLLIGDIGQPRGGPMKSGHRSHQIGLDVDVWLRPLTKRPTLAEREMISSYDVVEGRSTLNESLWAQSAWRAIQVAAEDPAVARIFVNATIKRKLCQVTPETERGWLRKVRPWWGHDSHFHVRLSCPAGVPGCKNQQPPPAGDGCGKALDWWFTDGPYSGSSKPKPKLTMADLPQQCSAVVAAE